MNAQSHQLSGTDIEEANELLRLKEIRECNSLFEKYRIERKFFGQSILSAIESAIENEIKAKVYYINAP